MRPKVLSSIDKEIVSAYERTGKRPTRIYLGYKEWDTIMTSEWSKFINYFVDHDHAVYNELSIYRVKEESHLFVA